jgi:hypothetical protein
LIISLMALINFALYVGDHGRLFSRYRSQTIQLDVAHADEEALRSHLEMLLGGRVVDLTVKRLDLVDDTTLVEVRYPAGHDTVAMEAVPASAEIAAQTKITAEVAR